MYSRLSTHPWSLVRLEISNGKEKTKRIPVPDHVREVLRKIAFGFQELDYNFVQPRYSIVHDNQKIVLFNKTKGKGNRNNFRFKFEFAEPDPLFHNYKWKFFMTHNELQINFVHPQMEYIDIYYFEGLLGMIDYKMPEDPTFGKNYDVIDLFD